jgi:hypothetical protein
MPYLKYEPILALKADFASAVSSFVFFMVLSLAGLLVETVSEMVLSGFT